MKWLGAMRRKKKQFQEKNRLLELYKYLKNNKDSLITDEEYKSLIAGINFEMNQTLEVRQYFYTILSLAKICTQEKILILTLF